MESQYHFKNCKFYDYDDNIFERSYCTSQFMPTDTLYNLSHKNYSQPMDTIIEIPYKEDMPDSTNNTEVLKSMIIISINILVAYTIYKL